MLISQILAVKRSVKESLEANQFYIYHQETGSDAQKGTFALYSNTAYQTREQALTALEQLKQQHSSDPDETALLNSCEVAAGSFLTGETMATNESLDPFDDKFNSGLSKIQDGIEAIEKLKSQKSKVVRSQIASLNQAVRDLTALIKDLS